MTFVGKGNHLLGDRLNQATAVAAEPRVESHAHASAQAEQCVVDISNLHADGLRRPRAFCPHLASPLAEIWNGLAVRDFVLHGASELE